MCYSKEQSIKTFSINLLTSYALYTYKNTDTNKILAVFFGFVGLMQLFDIIFWSNQDITNSTQANINYITTKMAMFVNHLQPIVLAYLIYLYIGSLGDFSKIILSIYVIVSIFYTLNAYNNISYTLTDHTNSLKWDWNLQDNNFLMSLLFVLAFAILSYENFKYPFNIILLFITFISYTLSKYYFKRAHIGRFWCKIVAWIPLLFLVFKFE